MVIGTIPDVGGVSCRLATNYSNGPFQRGSRFDWRTRVLIGDTTDWCRLPLLCRGVELTL